MGESDIYATEKTMFKYFGLVIFGIFIIISLFMAFYTINSDERGILSTFGKANPIAVQPGLHFKIPFVQTIEKMDIKTMKYEADASAASSNLQDVFTKVTVNYRVDRDRVVDIFTTIGTDYEKKLIQPIVQESVKAVTAKYTAEELITKRELSKNEISEIIKNRLVLRNIIVEDVSITNFSFSEEFNQAIEAKSIAQQQVEKAKQELARIEVEKAQRIVQSEADAQARKNQADADAYVIKVNADSQAYQLKVINEELNKSKDIVQYKYIEKWDGKMPTYYAGQSPVPILNIQ